MNELPRFNFSALPRDSALTLAIETARNAKRLLEFDPSIAEGDPDRFVAILTLFAFHQGYGDLEDFVQSLRGSKRAIPGDDL